MNIDQYCFRIRDDVHVLDVARFQVERGIYPNTFQMAVGNGEDFSESVTLGGRIQELWIPVSSSPYALGGGTEQRRHDLIWPMGDEFKPVLDVDNRAGRVSLRMKMEKSEDCDRGQEKNRHY